MMQNGHIYLTGYRGTGKSSVGVSLAKHLRCPLVDTDQVVEANAGKSIREIFAESGESRFRELEADAIQTVAEMQPAVISLGGGAVLLESNREVIARTGRCFWLDADATTIAARLQTDQNTAERRPALTSLDQQQEIEQLLQQRRPIYQQVADHRIETGGKSISQVAQAILQLLETDPPPRQNAP